MSAPAALITGGTSGIGRGTTSLLHERGFGVMVTGRNPAVLDTARADEVAETVAFLVSDGAAYITGQNIVVAGGGGLAT